jgi:uncharacterized phage protein (TIGR02218 family)
VITEADLLAGKWDYASVWFMRCNWADTSMGVIVDKTGVTGEVTLGREFTAELRGLAQALQQPIGRVVTATCDATLGDARCKVNMAAHTYVVTITSVTNRKQFASAALVAFNENDFKYGAVTFNTGANAGATVEIKSFLAGAIGLHIDAPNDIISGDTCTVVRGCKKTVSDCVSFDNIVNMRAFPYRPVTDEITSGPQR